MLSAKTNPAFMTASEWQEENSAIDFPTLWIALLLCAIPAIFYWRHDLFFMWDDWTELDFLAQKPFLQYLAAPDGEIFFPVFHFFFYLLVKLSGERHGILVLVNCLASGITAFLLYLCFQRFFSQTLSFILSILFATSAVQPAIVWNVFYLCYILSLLFFLLALLATFRYVDSSSTISLGCLGLFSLLSIHAHNYTLLALLVLPGYISLEQGLRSRKFLIVAGMQVGLISLFFLEYLLLAGTEAPTLYNREVLSAFPGFDFLVFWFYGAFLSPLRFFFIGHLQWPVFGIFLGLALLILLLAVIFWRGNPEDKRLALWALSLNALPFLMVSLGRHTLGLDQAFTVRYIYFTLVGALVLLGLVWTILLQRSDPGFVKNLVIWALPVIITVCQIFSLPSWQKGYLALSRQAQLCYAKPALMNDGLQLWLTPHYPLKPDQLEDIKKLLKEKVWIH
jgi:hypothetical protein